MARQVISSRSALFELEGMAELRANVAKIMDRTTGEEIKEVAMDGAGILLREFRDSAPVVTGKFRDSAFISRGDPRKADALFVIDFNKVRDKKGFPYVWVVEFGNSTHAPHHTMRNAITTTRSLIYRTIADGWRKALGIDTGISAPASDSSSQIGGEFL